MERLIKIGFIYEHFSINKNSIRCGKNIVYYDKKKTIINMLKLLFFPFKGKKRCFVVKDNTVFSHAQWSLKDCLGVYVSFNFLNSKMTKLPFM